MAAAGLGGFEGDVGDAFDFGLFVDHGIDGGHFAIDEGAAFGLAEVDAAGEFADAEDVEAAGDEFVFDWAGVGEGGVADAGSEIGEEAEVLAEWEEGSAFRLFGWGHGFPFRAADGAEEDGGGGFAGGDGFVGEGFAGGVDGGAADELVVEGEGEAVFLAGGFEDGEGSVHDFGADAVAGEDCDGERRRRAHSGKGKKEPTKHA